MVTDVMFTLANAAIESGKNLVRINHKLLMDAAVMIEDLKHRNNDSNILINQLEEQVKKLETELAKYKP